MLKTDVQVIMEVCGFGTTRVGTIFSKRRQLCSLVCYHFPLIYIYTYTYTCFPCEETFGIAPHLNIMAFGIISFAV